MKKTGVLLINLGTPDSPSTSDVRVYLREFLMDRRVIDIPFLNRWMLVNLIIAPFRAPKSAKTYQELWTERGSPLMFHGTDVKALLQESLGSEYVVSLGMRYQNPSIEKAALALKDAGVSEIIIIPLFPQYASATTGSAIEKAMEIIGKWEVVPQIKTIAQFHQDPNFISAFAKIGKKYLDERAWDHIIFSYHGIPERQIYKSSQDNYCKIADCCNKYHEKNRYCYRAQCFETTRLLTEALGLNKEQYTTCFQSRLGKTPWIQPYAEDTIKKLAKEGKKNILFFSPSFVADCLETTIEGGEEYKELFEENGGNHWQLVESLNSSKDWIDCLKEMVLNQVK